MESFTATSLGNLTCRMCSVIMKLDDAKLPEQELNSLSYVRSRIMQLEEIFQKESWMSRTVIFNLETLKTTVKEFENVSNADVAGRLALNKELLPYGLDYEWLQEMVNTLDLMLMEDRQRFLATKAYRERIRRASKTKFPNTGLFRLEYDDLVHNVTVKCGQQIKLEPLKAVHARGGAWSIVQKCEVVAVEPGVDIELGALVAYKELSSRLSDNFTQANAGSNMRARMHREQRFWRKFSHPNVAQFIGYIEYPRPGLISIWYDRGTIEKYLTDAASPNRISLILGCANGLAYLHAQQVIHGDVRPVNILIDDSHNPRLTDFGCTFEEAETLRPATFTESRLPTEPRYMAVERTRDLNKPSYESDVFSFGCLTLFIATSLRPFRYIPVEQNIIKLRLSSDINAIPLPATAEEYPELPDVFWPLLSDCWKQRPEARPTMEVVITTVKELRI